MNQVFALVLKAAVTTFSPIGILRLSLPIKRMAVLIISRESRWSRPSYQLMAELITEIPTLSSQSTPCPLSSCLSCLLVALPLRKTVPCCELIISPIVFSMSARSLLFSSKFLLLSRVQLRLFPGRLSKSSRATGLLARGVGCAL